MEDLHIETTDLQDKIKRLTPENKKKLNDFLSLAETKDNRCKPQLLEVSQEKAR